LHDLVKSAHKELAYRMAEELRKHRVAAIAITPGFLRSESMLEHFGVTEENWRDGGKKDPNFLESESPLFIGRAVAALAQDRKVLARSGDLTSSWELAREYGFTDADGRRPDSGKHFTENVIPSLRWMQEGLRRQIDWLERIARRGRSYLGAE
jgi:NAD(P)-dependent dehydrogenase (short-subunit alcohol dehydrogenase family)